ncbi:hypothetical protein SCG7086_CT_00050, partial [Chlamydiales bacterium SCGC AG-110-P3]
MDGLTGGSAGYSHYPSQENKNDATEDKKTTPFGPDDHTILEGRDVGKIDPSPTASDSTDLNSEKIDKHDEIQRQSEALLDAGLNALDQAETPKSVIDPLNKLIESVQSHESNESSTFEQQEASGDKQGKARQNTLGVVQSLTDLGEGEAGPIAIQALMSIAKSGTELASVRMLSNELSTSKNDLLTLEVKLKEHPENIKLQDAIKKKKLDIDKKESNLNSAYNNLVFDRVNPALKITSKALSQASKETSSIPGGLDVAGSVVGEVAGVISLGSGAVSLKGQIDKILTITQEKQIIEKDLATQKDILDGIKNRAHLKDSNQEEWNSKIFKNPRLTDADKKEIDKILSVAMNIETVLDLKLTYIKKVKLAEESIKLGQALASTLKGAAGSSSGITTLAVGGGGSVATVISSIGLPMTLGSIAITASVYLSSHRRELLREWEISETRVK